LLHDSSIRVRDIVKTLYVRVRKIIYHPQRGWYEEAPPRGTLSFGRSPEEPILPEEGPARAQLS